VNEERSCVFHAIDDINTWVTTPRIENTDERLIAFDCGVICIPLNSLKNLTLEQIGNHVLALVPEAQLSRARMEAQRVIETDGQYVEWLIKGDAPHYLEELKLLLAAFAPRSGKVAHALALCISVSGRITDIEDRKRFARRERNYARADYSNLFVAVGKRDGFHCAACATTKSLELDHITPVAQGGETTEENLQLLCRKCNASKGTTVKDYRTPLDHSDSIA